MSMRMTSIAILALAMGATAGCQTGFPGCKGGKCDPCEDCDQLTGSYEGWMAYKSNDCLGDIDPGMPDQPWGLSFDQILTDEGKDATYVEIDGTAAGYGVAQGWLCGPKDKDGSTVYAFCMNFSFDSIMSTGLDQQTIVGNFIEAADGSLRFEGQLHNQTHDPVNGACHVQYTVSADKVPVE